MNTDTSTLNKTIRVVFAGTPDFAVPSLRALHEISQHRTSGAAPQKTNCEIVAVYTQPDRPAGRGRKLRESDIKQLANTLDLPVKQPVSLRDPDAQIQLRELQADLMVVAAYGLLLPQLVLDTPRLGCVNIHASLLPRWRGAAPVQKAIISGDQKTGVTLMQMNAGLDTGDMLCHRETVISETDTGGELTDRLAQLGGQILLEEFDNLIAGRLQAVPQDDSAATRAPKIKKSAARINWGMSAEQIARQVRAFNPWPVAETTWRGRQLRLWTAAPGQDDTKGLPGKVFVNDGQISVATGNGVLLVHDLQPAGKRVMTAREFLNANDIAGQTLGACHNEA